MAQDRGAVVAANLIATQGGTPGASAATATIIGTTKSKWVKYELRLRRRITRGLLQWWTWTV